MNTKKYIGITLGIALFLGYIYISTSPEQEKVVPIVVEEFPTEESTTTQATGEEVKPVTVVTNSEEQKVTQPTPSVTTPLPQATQTTVKPTPTPASVNPTPKITMKKYWDILDTSILALTLNQIDLFNSLNDKKIECDIETYNCKEKILAKNKEYSAIQKEDYMYGWEDSKQAILSTDIYKTTAGLDTYYSKDFLYFYIDKYGNTILLSHHTVSVQTDSLVEAKILFTDTDNDGLGTVREKCETPYRSDPSCFVSDPNVRDTDGDGWWDGTEANL